MLDQVLDLFRIRADLDLNVMKPGQDLTDLACSILIGMREVFTSFRPDLMLVHGDTSTTLIATLAAYYHQIPVAHVEGGLRTGKIYSPWPEQRNRKHTGALTTPTTAHTHADPRNLHLDDGPADSTIITKHTDTYQI